MTQAIFASLRVLSTSTLMGWDARAAPPARPVKKSLDHTDVGGIRSFGAHFLFKRDALALLQGAEAITGDPAEVDEEVSAVVLLYKSITLSFIEPLYSSFHILFTFPLLLFSL